MLILVGVTINFALNGGIINKAKEASIQTEIATIQEQLMLKKAEILADNMGSVPAEGYGLTFISDLDGLSESTINKYNSKLTISPDGTLYYLEDKVTGEEKVYFENAGIRAYSEQEQGQNQERSDVEYYTKVLPQDGDTAELVLAVDYMNNRIKLYQGLNGANPSYFGSVDNLVFKEEPFDILLDDVQTTINDGIGIYMDNDLAMFIQNGKFYEGEPDANGLTKFDSSNYATLDPNFDTSRLVEVQAKTIEYYVGTTNNVSCVSVINYTNNTISYYQSSDNITYTLMPNSSGSITLGHETGTVTIDGETVTLSENDTIIYDENNEEHLALIRNNNIYFADNPTRYLSLGGGTLDPDFDASVLPE